MKSAEDRGPAGLSGYCQGATSGFLRRCQGHSGVPGARRARGRGWEGHRSAELALRRRPSRLARRGRPEVWRAGRRGPGGLEETRLPKAAQKPSGRGRSQAPGLSEPLLAGSRWQGAAQQAGAPGNVT